MIYMMLLIHLNNYYEIIVKRLDRIKQQVIGIISRSNIARSNLAC